MYSLNCYLTVARVKVAKASELPLTEGLDRAVRIIGSSELFKSRTLLRE